jgi:hypothetical protein
MSCTYHRFRLLSVVTLFLVVCLVPLTAWGAASSLTTTFASTAFMNGNMFDVTILSGSDQYITAFDLNLNSGSSIPIDIYYREGGYSGHETTASDWTLVTSAVVTSAGMDKPTPVSVTPLLLAAGKTYGFYITVNGPTTVSALRYIYGNNTYADDNLRITCGTVNMMPEFAAAVPNFTWNGTIYYTDSLTPPASADPPQTGDAAGNRLWLYGLGAVTAGVAALLLIRRRFTPRKQA